MFNLAFISSKKQKSNDEKKSLFYCAYFGVGTPEFQKFSIKINFSLYSGIICTAWVNNQLSQLNNWQAQQMADWSTFIYYVRLFKYIIIPISLTNILVTF